MIWTIVRKELLANLLTLRLTVALLFTVVLSVLTTVIGSMDFSERMQAYKAQVKEAREELDKATVYSEVSLTAIAPPEPLSILCQGIDRTVGHAVGIGIYYFHGAAGGTRAGKNELLATFLEIDFATVVGLLLSFLALILGFDGISGEQERGTLRLLLANPVPRGGIVIAKVIGGVVSLWIPLAMAFILSLIIMLANPDVHLGGEEWVRILLLFIISCGFLAEVFVLSLMVSSLVKRSATSLAICLFGWLLGAVAYPDILPSMSRYGVKGQPFEEFVVRRNELYGKLWEEVGEWVQKHPSPGELYLRGAGNWQWGRLRYAHPKGYEWLEQRYAFLNDRLLGCSWKVYQACKENFAPLAKQAKLTDELAVLSPVTNFQILSYVLARTTLGDHQRFLDAARRYRESFIEYLRGKKAFSSRRWFTDDPPDQEPMFPYPEEITPEMLAPDSQFMRKVSEWTALQEKKAEDDPRRKLDLTDLPKFRDNWRRSIPESLGVMWAGLAVLILGLGLGLTITITAFLRYEPRE